MNAPSAAAILKGLLRPAELEPLHGLLERLPDPEGAARALERLVAAGRSPDCGWLQPFLTLAGSSPFLGGLLVQNPAFLDALSGGAPPAPRTREDLGEDLARFLAVHSSEDASFVLRRFKQREYLRIALADFHGTADLPSTTRALSLLADVLLDRAVRIAEPPLRSRFGPPTIRDDQGHLEEARFAVIALGKLGGAELNYSSDIDLLYLFSRDGETAGAGSGAVETITNREFFRRLAVDVTRLIGGHGPEGQVFRVDLNLRPGGRDGELVTSLGAAIAYYRNWAEPWERQALIKARAVAGDGDLGRRFVALVEPLVFTENPDPYLALEIGAMKDLIDRRLASLGQAESDIKLGRGGIRELEFAVQALQLQHGGRDPWLHQGNTLLALHRLVDKGYIAYGEYSALTQAYSFLRDLEHRLQLGQDRQTSRLPDVGRERALLARRMRLGETPPGQEERRLAETLETHRDTIRRFYDSVFGRAAQPGIQEGAADPFLDRMDDAGLRESLRESGFPHPEAALRPVKLIRRLLQAVSDAPDLRRAIRKTGPALLRSAASAIHPRRALDNLEKLLSSIAVSPEALLRFVSRREILGPTVRLLGRSDLLAGIIIRQPGILKRLEDRAAMLRTPAAEDYRGLLIGSLGTPGAATRARAGRLRRRHQEALATIAVRDINRQATLREVLKSLSNLADASVEAALLLARDDLRERGPGPSADLHLAALGLGRLGYRELDYGSDLDLVFVHDAGPGPEAEARADAARWSAAAVRHLTTLSRDGQLYRVDLRLRPSGREGDVVVSLDTLREYFRRDADVWEMQAFLKARPVAGDTGLGRRAVAAVGEVIFERAAAMGAEAIAAAVEDMERRLRAGAHHAAGRGPNVKVGGGGIVDIHFTIEYLQLRHAVPSPADKDTLRLLTHLHALGHLADEQLSALYQGYLFLRALDHEMRLIHDRPMPILPDDPARRAELAHALDLTQEPGEAAARFLIDAFDVHTRAIRAVYESIVPGADHLA